jgi:transposase-like protein
MPPYSAKFRAKMIRQMTGPRARSATALAKEVGITQPTLSRWLREARTVAAMSRQDDREQGPDTETVGPVEERLPKDWSAERKLQVVVEASGLSEAEVGAFLRRTGLHEAQLEEWRSAALASLKGAGAKSAKKRRAPESKRIRALERELRRKEKALAETAALLVLGKKADALWGGEGDGT